MTDAFLAMATGLALSTAAGLNAYVPLLAAGIAAGTTDLIRLGPPFDRLEEPAVLAVVAAVGLVDFVGDKVPAVDHVLHAIGLVVAPVAGAVLALGVTSDEGVAPVIALVSGIVAAGATQGARTALRPVSTVGSGGVTNPILSLGEDGVSVTLSLTAIVVPFLALAIAVVVVVALVVAVRRVRTWLRGRTGGSPTSDGAR